MGDCRQRAGYLLPAAILLLLAGFAPRAASASCGDYVIFTGGEMRLAAPAGRHQLAPDVAGFQHTFPAQPCRGPNCSGRRDAPSAPPAPVQIQPRGDTPGMLLADECESHPGRASWISSDATLPLLDVCSSIFHPPRSAA